jgi:hypothetical protein
MGAYLMVMTTHAPEHALEDYRQRWQTECLFAVMKRRGFNLEDTHITDPERVARLIGGYDFSVVLVLQGRGLVGPATAYWCQETSAPRLECDPVGLGYAAPSFAQWRLTNTADTTLDLPPF